MSLIPKIDPNASSESLIKDLNYLIDEFNFLSKFISLKSNFDGHIVNVSFAAGEDKVVSHKLGVLPRYRIILRQEGNGVISDTPSGWNQYQIQLKNNGAVAVTATIMIVRE
ncbi:MAG: hypothetical protein H0X02_05075 [Nitrosomonas sp.]|nr:hypothetical protein [Nitrosomonas sp.]